MSEWTVAYPVAFTENGDSTALAIAKHIDEIGRMYALLGQLRSNFTGAGAPSGAVRNQLYINPNTFAAKVFVGILSENDWRDVICAPLKHDLDKHNVGTFAQLQALVTDAVLVRLGAAPVAADAGKILEVGADGAVVLSSALDALELALAALTARVAALEAAVPVMASVSALPAVPDPNTWYFVQEATTP